MSIDIDKLNKKYSKLNYDQRISELYSDFSVDDILFTSSFGASSALLLHLISKKSPKQKVHFLDTSYHFEETKQYRETLTELLNLDVIDIHPNKNANRGTKEKRTWESNANECCDINKVKPLNEVKAEFKIWISGVMQSQNDIREGFEIFQQADGIIKFHPIVDLTDDDGKRIIEENKLPNHPLQQQGYDSIGCKHCTSKGKGRSGRWQGKPKTECGLHQTKPKNIHPIFNRVVSKADKEQRLNQVAKSIWLIGLSGSGKSSIAVEIEKELFKTGYFAHILDGDNVRTGINNNLGFTSADRDENIRRIAEVSKLFNQAGVITINCFITPTEDLRAKARQIIGESYVEVFIDTSLEECERRDVKGLYEKARRGEIENFTGINAPFEKPKNSEIVISTDGKSVKQSTDELYIKIFNLITK